MDLFYRPATFPNALSTGTDFAREENIAMRIPITMCHGITSGGDHPLTVEHFDCLMKIASDMG